MKRLKLFDESAHLDGLICGLSWQGDFGKGVDTGSGVWSDPGANPCVLYGPAPAAGVTDNGIPFPSYKLGMVVNGDSGTEFVYGKLVLAAVTDILPGQAYQFDENYAATLLTTANSVLNANAVVLSVWAPQLAAGTYYGWFARAGNVAMQAAAGSVANGQGETTATGGQLKFVSNTGHTAGTKSIGPTSAYQASSGITFTGNTTSGSPYITGVVSGNVNGAIADLQVGQVIAGANLPANAIIAAIDRQGSGWRVTIGTNAAGSYSTLQTATATAAGTIFTVTNMVIANLAWPTLSTQN
jgi:hypothetical protein